MERAVHQVLATGTQQVADQEQSVPDTAPPPYVAEVDEFALDDEDEDDCSEEPLSQPNNAPVMKLTLNAVHSVNGQNNVVPTSGAPLLDAAKLTAVLLASLQKTNITLDASNNTGDATSPAARRCSLSTRRRHAKRPLTLDLTINCGIHINGHRNVVGPLATKSLSNISQVGTTHNKRFEHASFPTNTVEVPLGPDGVDTGNNKRKRVNESESDNNGGADAIDIAQPKSKAIKSTNLATPPPSA